jgi:DNA segregation ATPase FtsK/SpoIIIE-like protein
MDQADFKAMHLPPLPDPEEELRRAFGFLVEKRDRQDGEAMTGCTSYVQRKLQCGYNRAALLLDQMVESGWITEPDNVGARRLLPQPPKGCFRPKTVNT